MVQGVGIDIVEIERVKHNILRYGDKFLNRIYTKKEIEYCNSKNKNMYESYAGKYAAKEAVFKCISNKKSFLKYSEIEILNYDNGKPYAVITNNNYSNLSKNIYLSISHDNTKAIASCILDI